MSFTPAKKQTLLIPSGSEHHLFFVVTDRCSAGCHLLVNLSSIEPSIDHDNTCELGLGDHPFVKQPSLIMYGMAEKLDHEILIAKVNNGRYKPMDPVGDDVFDRICAGILKSPFTKPAIKNYYRQVTGLLVVVSKRKIIKSTK